MALRGYKVIEIAGLAPAPFCGMILKDFGASVVRVDRPKTRMDADRLSRGKQSVVIDLKKPAGVDVFKKLCDRADVLIEPFRAGVMESLKLGPDVLLKNNPRLIYARLTGFGQNGPFAKMAGHDINYIALSGILSMFGESGRKPHPPVNVVADFAGGGLLCALGICMALLERHKSNLGQVIDANMVEGSAYVGSFLWRTRSSKLPFPIWMDSMGKNVLDGGAPFYQTYETKDGKYVSVGALEPQFYKALLKGLNLRDDDFPQFGDWDGAKKKFSEIFASKTRDEWASIFDGSDACVVPVLNFDEADKHPHNVVRKSFSHDEEGNLIPNPAPVLSRTPANPEFNEPLIGEHSSDVLQSLGYCSEDIKNLVKEGIVECSVKSNL